MMTLKIGAACVAIAVVSGCSGTSASTIDQSAGDPSQSSNTTSGDIDGAAPSANAGANNDGGPVGADGAAIPASDGGSGNPSIDPNGSLRDLCVKTINSYRALNGLTPYVRWPEAEICSDGEAKTDSETRKAHSAFGSCRESAQNECPGWPGAPETAMTGCLKMMWAEGPGADFATHGHYLNMSSTKYKSVSCGFYKTATGSWWMVQNFH